MNHTAENRVLEVPNFLDIYNRDFTRIKQDVIGSFIDQINNDPELYHKSYLVNLSQVLFKVVLFFSDYNPSGMHTQITSLNSLVFKCMTQKGINFYLETFFDEDSGNQIETVVNVLKEQEQLFNDSGELEEMLSALKQNFDFQEPDS